MMEMQRTRPFRVAAVVAVAEPVLVAGALPCLVVLPLRYAPIGLGLVALSWLVRWLTTGRLSARTPADWAILLLMAMAPVTLWMSSFPGITWSALALLFAGLAVFNLMTSWAHTEQRLLLCGWGLVAAGVALASLAPYGVMWANPGKFGMISVSVYDAMPRLLGDPINRNVMAGALALVAPVPLSFVVLSREQLRQAVPRWLRLGWGAWPLLVLAWLLMVAGIVLTQSRAALAATAITTGLILTLWRPRVSLTFLVILATVALAWTQVAGQGFAVYLTRAVRSWETRLNIWSRSIAMITDFPLTGIGMGTFRQMMSAAYPLSLRTTKTGTANHAHNLLLQVGVDLGLPGLVAYLALWLTATVLVWRTYRTLRRDGRLALSALAAGLGASLITLMIHGLFDAVTWGTKPAFLAWAVMGLAIALYTVCCPQAGKSRSAVP
jgi:putative inorganic carbon (HCO3(-)) transporter